MGSKMLGLLAGFAAIAASAEMNGRIYEGDDSYIPRYDGPHARKKAQMTPKQVNARKRAKNNRRKCTKR